MNVARAGKRREGGSDGRSGGQAPKQVRAGRRTLHRGPHPLGTGNGLAVGRRRSADRQQLSIVAQADAWRLFFGLLALIGILNLGLGLLTVDEQPPQNPERPIDVLGLALAAVGTVRAFYGSYDIETGNPSSPVAWTIAGIGLLALVALLVLEYRSDDPFIPVKPLSTSLPVLGVVCAMVSGAVFVALLELMETLFAQGRHLEPLASGLLFWPLIIGTGLAAFVFWRLFTTKFTSEQSVYWLSDCVQS